MYVHAYLNPQLLLHLLPHNKLILYIQTNTEHSIEKFHTIGSHFICTSQIRIASVNISLCGIMILTKANTYIYVHMWAEISWKGATGICIFECKIFKDEII